MLISPKEEDCYYCLPQQRGSDAESYTGTLSRSKPTLPVLCPHIHWTVPLASTLLQGPRALEAWGSGHEMGAVVGDVDLV